MIFCGKISWKISLKMDQIIVEPKIQDIYFFCPKTFSIHSSP